MANRWTWCERNFSCKIIITYWCPPTAISASKPISITVPGLLKLRVVKKPARKARKGVNPFTGEEMMFKAKPARNVVKILPLKNLKEMA